MRTKLLKKPEEPPALKNTHSPKVCEMHTRNTRGTSRSVLHTHSHHSHNLHTHHTHTSCTHTPHHTPHSHTLLSPPPLTYTTLTHATLTCTLKTHTTHTYTHTAKKLHICAKLLYTYKHWQELARLCVLNPYTHIHTHTHTHQFSLYKEGEKRSRSLCAEQFLCYLLSAGFKVLSHLSSRACTISWLCGPVLFTCLWLVSFDLHIWPSFSDLKCFSSPLGAIGLQMR
jgi:hypothetical protein